LMGEGILRAVRIRGKRAAAIPNSVKLELEM